MYAHEALQQVFGETYNKLPNEQKHALQTDVTEVFEEEMDGGDDTNVVTLEDAAIELRRRIGGVDALPLYAKCLAGTLRNR